MKIGEKFVKKPTIDIKRKFKSNFCISSFNRSVSNFELKFVHAEKVAYE